MIKIPKTNPQKYVSGIVALNIHSPKGTGDWHSAVALNDLEYPEERYIYGEGQSINTNNLLGNIGIIDGTERLNKMGYYPENSPVWIADHPRACFDYLYVAVLKTGLIGRIILEDWFPSEEDKISVYSLLNIAEQKLTQEENEILKAWKTRNSII